MILPDGKDYTFWGKGVSQGHSDAIRRIKGVKNAKQYTCPVESAMRAVRNGENPELTTREKHIRECFVVLEDGADAAYVENKLRRCRTISPTIIPWFISFRKKNLIGTIRAGAWRFRFPQWKYGERKRT